MITLRLNVNTGTAAIIGSLSVTVGQPCEVRIEFPEAPTVVQIQLGIGRPLLFPDSLLAFLDIDEFTVDAADDTVYLATLDGTDVRLARYMAALPEATIQLGIIGEVDGTPIATPYVNLTVQAGFIGENPNTQGGPTYYTAAQTDAAIAEDGGGTIAIARTIFADSVHGGTAPDADGTLSRPFSTLAEAYTAAVALAPSAAAPVVMNLAGTFAEALTISTAYLTLQGAGMDRTLIKPPATGAVTIKATNTTIEGLTIARAAGGNAAAVFHMTNPAGTAITLATWIDNVHLRNVRISNPNGTAVGTITAKTSGLVVDDSEIGIDYNYGGLHVGARIVGAQYGVYQSQSCAHQLEGHPSSVHWAAFFNSYLSSTDIDDGWAIGSSNESAYANRGGEDADGQNVVLAAFGEIGADEPTWYPTIVKSSKIMGASVASDEVFPATPATSECFRGTFYLDGNTIYGDVPSTWAYASYVSGGVITSQRPTTTAVLKNMSNVTFNGVNIIFSGSNPAFTALNSTIYANCVFENDALIYTSLIHSRLEGCRDHVNGLIGSERRDLALRCKTTDTYAQTATSSDHFTARTVECWVKLPAWSAANELVAGTENIGIISAVTAGGAVAFYLAAQRLSSAGVETAASRQVYGGFGGGTVIYTNSANAVLNDSAGPFGDFWHHIAVVLTDTTQQLFIDGVAVGSTAAGALISTPVRWIFGGYTSNGNPSTALLYNFFGLLRNARISSSVRYPGTTTFAPQALFFPDAETLSLWSDTTSRPLVWKDQMGRRDAVLISGANQPLWVPQSYTP